jgi:hypothetical protein
MVNKFAIALLVFWASTTDVKVADVQPVELVSLGILATGILIFILKGFRIKLGKISAVLAKNYIIFSLVMMTLVCINLQQTFFVPGTATSIIKQPFWISLSRFIQLTMIYTSFLYLLECFRTEPRLLRFAIRIYVVTGIISAVYGLVSYAILRISGLDLYGAYDTYGLFRTKGFFVEGGPFGLYMLSVMILKLFQGQIFNYKLRVTDYIHLVILFSAFVLSVSKSAILAMVMLVIFYQLVSRISIKAFILTVVVSLVMAPILYKPIVLGIEIYQNDYQNFAQAVIDRPDDQNLIMGRIAGSFIVPQMILQRPFLGVGLGNYSLTRNDPNYSRGIPAVEYWDLPGLGLLGYLAELGIPLTLYLIYLLCRPLIFGFTGKANAYVLTLLCFQLIDHLMGVQLTFIYPWIITAIALGIIHHMPHTQLGKTARHDSAVV